MNDNKNEKELLNDAVIYLSHIVDQLHTKIEAIELDIKEINININTINLKKNVKFDILNEENEEIVENKEKNEEIDNKNNDLKLDIDINKNITDKTLSNEDRIKLIRARRKKL